ncbi:unnamed protein product [Allacma fusca]|uniref:HTH CENPB-type domain-containing protein n=1 Tax=Allacma fusca TaxID=39272 RepID=A0A8J2NPA2_9HEXA|nr:unnamed protein product [Allacma fusca]
MVRYYQRRSVKVPGQTIRDAVQYYATSGNQRETCTLYGLTRSMFQKYLKQDPASIPDECSQGRFKPIFSTEQEEEIISYVNCLANRFYAITRRSLGELAFQLAERNNLPHTFRNGTASEGWINSFLGRHEDILSLRTGTPTSFARVTEFARGPVYRFFDLLEEIVSAKGFTADTIFNMDETGLTVVPSKQPKRIAQKGRRSLPVIVAKERGELCTILCSFSANGKYIPPMFIFPKKAKNINYANAPAESIHAISDRGWSNSECFVKWLKHFRKFASDSQGTNVLLLVDNHGSHICYEAVKYCRSHRIELLTLPPHSTHKLQPLDVGLFSPLKAKYSEYLVKWHFENQNKIPRVEDIPAIFRLAYEAASKRETAINAFRATGIWQYNMHTEEWKPNRHVFDEEFSEQESSLTDSVSSSNGASDIDSPPDSPDSELIPDTPDPVPIWPSSHTLASVDTQPQSKKQLLRLRRESLVPYSSSSEDEEEIEQIDLTVEIREVQENDDSLVASGELPETNVPPVETILHMAKASTSKASHFTVGPFELESELVNLDPKEKPCSKRKPRPKLAAEHMTSDENMSRLRTKELNSKRKRTSSDSEDKRQTRSTTVASKLSLRSGKRL